MLNIRAVVGIVLMWLSTTANGSVESCAYIIEANARLNCFDSYYAPALQAEPLLQERGQPSEPPSAPVSLINARLAQEDALTDQWFSITPHEANYILPATYNGNSDFTDFGAAGDAFSVHEVKMQISLKTRLARGLWRDSSIWAGYTQQAYWQLYADKSASSPFRETNHQPEVFWQIPIQFSVLGWNARLATFALNHQSNGQSEPLSRSWNRITGELALDRGGWVFSAKTWARINEAEDIDDNPDIENYMGRIQLGLAHTRENHTFSVNLKNNLSRHNRSGIEVNYTFPLLHRLKGFVQIYSGYGENLIDMDNYSNRIGFGIALTDRL